MENNYEASPAKWSSRAIVLIAMAVVVSVIAYSLGAPGNATLGYHLVSLVIKLISYLIILIAIAAAIAAVKGKFRTHTLLIFGWLFLAATLLDLAVAARRKFVVEPEVRGVLEQMERRP